LFGLEFVTILLKEYFLFERVIIIRVLKWFSAAKWLLTQCIAFMILWFLFCMFWDNFILLWIIIGLKIWETYEDTYMTCMSETSAIKMLWFKINLNRPEYILWHLLNSCDVYTQIHLKLLVTYCGLSIVLK